MTTLAVVSVFSFAFPPAPFGILMGLCAAVAWGLSDFCLRGVSRSGTSPIRSLGGMFVVATLGLSAALPFSGALTAVARCPAWALGVLALLGGGLVLGNLCLYHALAKGQVSLIAPIATSHTAITVLLSIVTGQRLTLLAFSALTMICGGVALASLPSLPSLPKRSRRSNGGATVRRLVDLLIASSTIATPRFQVALASASTPACLSAPSRGSIEAGIPLAYDLLPGHQTLPRLEVRFVHVRMALHERPLPLGSLGLMRSSLGRSHSIRAMDAPTPSMPRQVRHALRVSLPSGIPEALCGAMFLGAVFWAMRFVAPVLGPTATAWMLRANGAAVLCGWLCIGAILSGRCTRCSTGPAQREMPSLVSGPLRWMNTYPESTAMRTAAAWKAADRRTGGRTQTLRRHCGLVVAVGLLDALATLAYSVGVSVASPVLVAPPAALSVVLTVTLGYMVLGEQLGGRRLGGVILSLCGIVLLSTLSG